ncbi:hypothetical protein [Streptomyces roseicoloratus]|uniref:Lipoprotein n=1 Tax=Streptomyces roseicoloratus TaxID=2508722 RepID=A0ABY9S2I3_9ACTN|nr:hypothetical protein [Streptomyces roseicoloratus]WMX48639.1 hypothetical protein RGF97_32910 [Streptomyces roseicoloratus]
MIVLILSGVIVLALAGCGCVVWAARGGPRWVRAVATVTLAAGELVRRSQRASRTSNSTQDSGD